MIEEELRDLIAKIQAQDCEWQTLEVKSAHRGCPEKLYDTISAFSNQDDGGIFVFGLDEQQGFAKVGVYDAQDLQKKMVEYCEQMTPPVRMVTTVYSENGMVFVSAEIPPLDLADRPCFKSAKGRLKGAYKREGDADKPMTEYEVYSYEAFRKKLRDDLRAAEDVALDDLNPALLDDYLTRMRRERPNLASLEEAQQLRLCNVTRYGGVTMAALLLFGLFPQSYFPRLCINAACIPGKQLGDTDELGNRFIDSKRIEGTLQEMLDAALDFVRKNTRTSISIHPLTGKRTDLPQYPMDAVREAVLNSLVHRDYSIHTEGIPIQLNLYEDRLELINPGGVYGRLTMDQLGHAQTDSRNPALVTAMETLGKTENRFSGIPTIRRAMALRHLPEPVFENTIGTFKVTLYHTPLPTGATAQRPLPPQADEKELLRFCRTPRSRADIMAFLHISSSNYAFRRYIDPLLQSGALRMTIPEKPRSHSQQYVTTTSCTEHQHAH